MSYSHRSIITLSFALIVGLSGCGKQKPLKPLIQPLEIEQGCIAFEHKASDKKECKQHFGYDLIEKGYQPIHITTINNSNHAIVLKISDITPTTIPYQKIKKLYQSNHMARIVGYNAIGVPVGTLACGFVAAATRDVFQRLIAITTGFYLLPVALGTAWIASIIDYACSTTARTKNLTRIKENLLTNQQDIIPHGIANGVIFVKADEYDGNITLPIIDTKTDKTYFLNANDNKVKI